MKRWTFASVLLFGVVIVFSIAFAMGRYSHLICKPEMFFNETEKWAVNRARAFALEKGIPQDRLADPQVVDAVRVYFGGMAGAGGVEVTMMKENGLFLDIKY